MKRRKADQHKVDGQEAKSRRVLDETRERSLRHARHVDVFRRVEDVESKEGDEGRAEMEEDVVP